MCVCAFKAAGEVQYIALYEMSKTETKLNTTQPPESAGGSFGSEGEGGARAPNTGVFAPQRLHSSLAGRRCAVVLGQPGGVALAGGQAGIAHRVDL